MHAQDLFETITGQLIADIEAGAGTWTMPWHALADAGTPVSIAGRPYRGINALWLPLVGATQGWATGVWGTYKGWQATGAQVRRGQHATPVVLWKPTKTRGRDTEDTTDDGDDAGPRRRLVVRTYNVFAAEQVDGAEHLITERTERLAGRDTPERIAVADAYFAAVGARVIEGGNQAYYQPATDTIHVPSLAQFDHPWLHAGTLAHEHGHWTGHPSRLDRDLSGRFGSDAYAAEELVAELGAAMWCAQMDLSAVTRPDHAAYLAHWLHILRTDARALITVASKAQGAVDHLNTRAQFTPPGAEPSAATEPDADTDAARSRAQDAVAA
jgi:antirestriction protein ArdC